MGAVYFQSNNSFIKRPITHDYTDPSSLLGVSDKDLCTNLQTVIYGEISICNAGYPYYNILKTNRKLANWTSIQANQNNIKANQGSSLPMLKLRMPVHQPIKKLYFLPVIKKFCNKIKHKDWNYPLMLWRY